MVDPTTQDVDGAPSARELERIRLKVYQNLLESLAVLTNDVFTVLMEARKRAGHVDATVLSLLLQHEHDLLN
jgi:hypothetical protein